MITATQADLLRAALLKGDAAAAAFERWTAQVDLERLDIDSTRLLPLVHANLRAGVPLTGKIVGMQRHTWSKNQLLLRSVRRAVHDLSEAGVPSLLLRGMAIVLSAYDDWGLRTMSDAHILIRPDAHNEACGLLRSTGWTLSGTPHPDWPSVWTDASGQRVRLHTRSVQEATDEFEESLWRDRVKIEGWDIPCREHLLMQTLTCGQFAPRGPAFRWVADAHWLMRRGVDLSRVWNLLPVSGLDAGWAEAMDEMKAIGFDMHGHAQHAPPEERRAAFRALRRRHAWFGEIARARPWRRAGRDRAALLRAVFNLPDDAGLFRFGVGAAWKRWYLQRQ